MTIEHPSVTADFDGQCAALDEAIREAAADFNFKYVGEAPRFNQIQKIPQVIYELIRHYTNRGFICVYDGDEGTLTIAWDHPNMSYLENKQITRAIPSMIPNLGIAFRASMLYLCMTNNTDLRKHSDVTLQREIKASMKNAAVLGNKQLEFGFPAVPAPAVQNLFRPTFDMLTNSGFTILYDASRNVFILKWGQTFELAAQSGEQATAPFLPLVE